MEPFADSVTGRSVNFGRGLFVALTACLFLAACCGQPSPDLAAIKNTWSGPTTRGLTEPSYDPDVLAVCDAPLGWIAQPLKKSSSHTHQVWLSPTGATAYGVIHFTMPLPVGEELALGGFINQMRKDQGDAKLLSKQEDSTLGGIRFVAEGGLYKIRGNLTVSGWQGWAVYAGTLRKQPVNDQELQTAVRARDQTKVGEIKQAGK